MRRSAPKAAAAAARRADEAGAAPRRQEEAGPEAAAAQMAVMHKMLVPANVAKASERVAKAFEHVTTPDPAALISGIAVCVGGPPRPGGRH